MKGYLSIGAVAKRKGVSIKSLRYYDQIGILRPAYVNQETNYRYYTEEQLYLLDAISLCVELGIPLKDFDKYTDDHGRFQLQSLLYDGKLLAEQKIRDIHRCLGTVQAALQALDYKPIPLYHETVIDPKAAFYQRHIPVRAVLTSPLTGQAEENYSQKILRLFMLAQLLGMTASYPSGILYEYDAKGNSQRYIFIQVEHYADCTDKRLHMLPAGTYSCKQGSQHHIVDADYLKKRFHLSGKPFIVVESDLIDDTIKQGDNTLELQLFQNG